MSDQHFHIKIADLLNEIGKKDEISFENKLTQEIQGLDKNWVSGTFTMQSLNDESLYGTLHNIQCVINESCDNCQKAYAREVKIEAYGARFTIPHKEWKEEESESDEAVFFVNAKDETINIEDMVAQAVILQEPFIKHCPDCEKRAQEEGGDDDDVNYLETKSNIVFR